MKEDQTIERIRKTSHEISELCDHDPKKLIEYYKDYQKKSGNKLSGKPKKTTLVKK
jgi:hypothetical protein